MRLDPPDFWRHGSHSILPALLDPIARLVARATARRVARPGWTAPVPVICCGNATVGGAGKTTLALDLARRFQAGEVAVHFLTRGYGGSAKTCLRVDPAGHDATLVGDEALLLAACAPCWVGADRAETARAAVQNGAQLLVMDDGLQNPTLVRSCALLVIDGEAGFGNGHVLPAGPLREPVLAACRRVHAAIMIGPDRTGARALLPPSLPVLHARLLPDPAVQSLSGRKVLAFAGIGRPEKFFAMLRHAGLEIAGTVAFTDHHAFTAAEISQLLSRASSLGAVPVTTPKDHVRLDPSDRMRIRAIGVGLDWDDPAALADLLAQARVLTLP